MVRAEQVRRRWRLEPGAERDRVRTTGRDRVEAIAPDTGPGKDRLDEEDTPGEQAEVQAEHRDRREHGVPERVTTQDATPGEALGAGGPDIVLVEDLEHAPAGDPRHHAD